MQKTHAIQLDAREADNGLRRGRIHVLKAGTWPANPRDLTLSDSDLTQIAAAYVPGTYQAPVVLGHPENDHPAYGWTLGLFIDANGMWAEVEVTPSLAEAIEAGHYRTVSVSLWPPGASGNPAPAGWSLKHIGFLGAKPPAVKGLTPLQLAASNTGESVTTTFDLQERDMPENDTAAREAAQAAKAAELAQQAATLAEREQRVAQRELQLKRDSWRADINTHVNAGRVLPTEADGLVALMERLDGGSVTLAENEQPAIDVLRGFIGRLPARVDLSERSAGDASGNGQRVAQFQAPHGYTLAESGARLHAAALAWQQTHPGIDFLTAVRAVQTH